MIYSNAVNGDKKEFFHALVVLGFYSIVYVLFFSPVLFSGRILAPGDGISFHLPNFISGTMIWDASIGGGFPVAADMQSCAWYPVWHFFRLFQSWNGFVVSAYVLSACFSYGYLYSLTQSKFASLVGGTVYSMSGFMLAHLGHATVIHSSIWLPLFIWSLHGILEEFQWKWCAAGSISIAFSLLCGHPQIPFYTLIVGAIYVLVLGFSSKRKFFGFYVGSIGIVLFGVTLAAIQLIPSFELLQFTLRSKLKFSEFITYSIEPYQLLQFVFPNMLGGSGWPFQKVPYFGSYNLGELTGYVGILPLLLSAVAVVVMRKKIMIWLWVGVALYALLMALGDSIPLSKVIYHVPFYNKFRAPARHFVLFTFAISVLSGFGILAIQKRLISWKSSLTIALTGVLCSFVAAWILVLLYPRINEMANKAGLQKLELYPWSNFSSGIPLVLFFLSALVLLFWFKESNSVFRKLCLMLILVFDLTMFGWFRDWRIASPKVADLAFPPELQKYHATLKKDHQRILAFRGNRSSRNQAPPNLSRLWKISNAGIYTPMMFTRMSDLLSMTYWGAVHPTALLASDQSFDLMAIRYLSVSKNDIVLSPVPIVAHGLWGKEDETLSLGRCAKNQPQSVEFQLPSFQVTSIGIVSDLGCSAEVHDNREVVKIIASDDQGSVQEINLLAGRDTSEWAIDCMPYRMNHRRATIFQSQQYRTKNKECNIHTYVAKFSLNLSRVRRLRIEVTHPRIGINLRKLSLWNQADRLAYYVPLSLAAINDGRRWQNAGEIGETIIYENRFAKQRAWLVSNVITSGKVLDVIKTSRMSGGDTFQPSNVALVEESLNFNLRRDKAGRVSLKDISNNVVDVTTKSRFPAFLVLSDPYYPGWKASIDGKETYIYKTNYFFRGVLLPAGRHLVRFEYKPAALYVGAVVSVFSLITLAILFLKEFFSRKQRDHLSQK